MISICLETFFAQKCKISLEMYHLLTMFILFQSVPSHHLTFHIHSAKASFSWCRCCCWIGCKVCYIIRWLSCQILKLTYIEHLRLEVIFSNQKWTTAYWKYCQLAEFYSEFYYISCQPRSNTAIYMILREVIHGFPYDLWMENTKNKYQY